MTTMGLRAARRVLSSLLVAAMVLGTAATVLAADGERGQGKEKAFKAVFRLDQRFDDVKEAPWADRFITEAQVSGILRGYEERGRLVFRPNQPVKRQEAVAMVVRSLGLEERAQQVADAVYGVTLPFQDAGQIQSWAVGHVAVALEEGWITADGGMFQPMKAASRVWMVPILVRAMGLEDQARQRMGEQLPFRDAAAIPADAVGYVAVAVDVGLISGFEDRTFRPHQPVTRAQMAKVLQVMRDDLEQGGQQPVPSGVVRGVVAAVGKDSVAVKAIARTRKEYPMAAGAPVYVDDRPATLTDLQAGMLVRLFLNDQGAAVLVDAHTARALEPPVPPGPGKGKAKGRHPRERELRGQVTAIDPDALTMTVVVPDPDIVCVTTPCGRQEALRVAEWARVNLRGEGYGTLADIQVGDTVQVHIRGDVVVKVQVKGPEDDGDAADEPDKDALKLKVKGVISAIADGVLSVETESGEVVEVTVDARTRLEIDGKAATLEDLRVGDRVEVELRGDAALRIQVKSNDD